MKWIWALCAWLLVGPFAAAEVIPVQLDRKGVKSPDQVVYGVDAASGKVVWERRFPQEANFAKAVNGGILVGCDDGAVYLLAPADGAVLWSAQVGEKDEKVNGFHGTHANGWLVSYHDNVYWLVSPKGSLVWTLR